MVFLPLPDDDDEVLEATRALQQYVSRVQEPVGLRELLQQRATGIAEELMRQELEVKELLRSCSAVPSEVRQLQEENAVLARRGQELLAEQAAAAAQRSALEEVHEQRQREAAELRAERVELLQRLEALQLREAEAKGGQEAALKALDLERQRDQELAQTLRLALQERHGGAQQVEGQVEELEKDLRRLEATEAAACQEASEATRGQALAAQGRSELRQKLEQQLEELEESAEHRSVEEQQLRAREERHSRRFGARQRLSEAREERRRLEASSAQLTWQLQESERKASESDRKAMAVARELTETSRSVKALRSELRTAPLQRALEKAQQEAGALQQRLGNGERGGRGLLEALRVAWENEAQERRAAEEQLRRAVGFWAKAREVLRGLAAVARRSSTEVPLDELWELDPGGAARALVDVFEAHQPWARAPGSPVPRAWR